MTRSVAREIAVRFVFSQPFGGQPLEALLESCGDPAYYQSAAEEDSLFKSPPGPDELTYLRRVVEGVSLHATELDVYIEKYARGWSFGRISRVAAAVMRVAMFETLYMPEIPIRVAMNEAVEIAKKYETRETVSFINGVLGSFVRAELPDSPGAGASGSVDAPPSGLPEPDAAEEPS